MASNPDVEVVRRSCRYMDGTQDLDIPVQQSDMNSIKHLNVRKLIYDTIYQSYIPELVTEQELQPSLAQRLLSTDPNVPVSNPSPGLYISHASTPAPPGQPLQSLCNMVNFVTTASKAQTFNQLPSMQLSPAIDNSALPAPRCPNINQQMSFRQQVSASYNVAPRAPPALRSADIKHQLPFRQPSSVYSNAASPVLPPPGCINTNHRVSCGPPFPSPNNVTSPAPRSAIHNHQMSLRQPSPVPCNSVQSASRSADINKLLSFSPSFPSPHKFGPPASLALRGGNINHQMFFRQPLPGPSNSTPSASPALGCHHPSHQINGIHPPPAPNNSMFFARPSGSAPRRAVRLSTPAKEILNKWFYAHIEHPYPDEESVEMLSIMCNITAKKVQKWCSNKRMRSKVTKEQPKLEPPKSPTTSASEYSFVDLRNACDL